MYVCVQSCSTLCKPMDCGLPDPSVHGIVQARILEWAAISLSGGSSQPRDGTPTSCMHFLHWQVGSLRPSCWGSPNFFKYMTVTKSILLMKMWGFLDIKTNIFFFFLVRNSPLSVLMILSLLVPSALWLVFFLPLASYSVFFL